MIYLIFTACIDSDNDREGNCNRKDRYLVSIKSCLDILSKYKYDIKPIIVDNNGLRKTYLDDLGCDVFYTNNNKVENVAHKGVKELLDIKDVIKHYNIKLDDTIIKLTGRYKIYENYFLDLVTKNHNNYEGFVKFFNVCTKRYHKNHDDCILGLFALKCKHILDFNYKKTRRSPEQQFAIYVRDTVKLENIYQIEQNLYVEFCFAERRKNRIAYF
tara:strand:- start:4299 stop:4943 length:645 start_codon:yes stop_codon:yes gene_type:complete